MQALGERTIPAVFKTPCLYDVADVAYWPDVRSGIWSKEEAIRYVDHLFEFDPRSWAREHGLLQGNPSDST